MKMKKCLLLFCILLIGSSFGFAQRKIDLLILNKKYNEALIEIDKGLSESPNIQLYLKKGNVLSQLQNYQEALGVYSQALMLEPDNVEVLSEMAGGLAIMGNNFDAARFYEKAIEITPGNLVLSGKLGRVYINQKRYTDAYKVFSRVYEQDSTNIYWNKQMAFCSFKVGRKKQAIYLYEKVLNENPRDYGSYSNLIHLYDRVTDADKIVALIESGLVQFPGDLGLYEERAGFYFRTRNYEQAMIEFEKLFNAGADPVYDIKMNYAISCYFAGQEQKSLKELGDLFRANPNDPFVMFYQSLCNKKLVNYEEAEKMMKWAIESSVPDYVAEMYHHLGQIYGLQRKFKESIAALKKANEHNPENHEILFEIATTYEEFNNNKTLALNYYQVYLKEGGKSAENVNYALDRISKIKEDLFFEE